MRVLVVSHNVFSRTNNMGKTLLSYFSGFSPEEIAQFYIHSEVPTVDTVCRNYFRFTDKDAIRSLIPFRRLGRSFGPDEIDTHRATPRTDSGLVSDAYRMGQKRTPLVYLLRNLLWRLGRWDTPKLRQWIRDFDPDVIFYASGDYSFMYRVACRIADIAGKPLVTVCMDDYYINNRNHASLLGRLQHRRFMKTVYNTADRSSLILTICDSMAEAYEPLLGKPCRVLHTPAPVMEVPQESHPTAISYIGNLINGRNQSLVTLGRAWKSLSHSCIDVYSTEKDPRILEPLTEDNGIRFHGAATADQIPEIMARSAAVIHTESFDPDTRALVRFSVSTKIAESMMYGPPLIAYGPLGVASMDYLNAHNAAFVITDRDDPLQRLQSFLEDLPLRQSILENARELARRNHDPAVNTANIRRWLSQL